MDLPITLGRYELLAPLGAGSVVSGRAVGELGLRHEVAIRVLAGQTGVADDLAGLADEAAALSRIGHSCVVPIADLATVEHPQLGTLGLLVTPWVRGVSLAGVLDQCWEHGLVLPLAATLHLLLQLADTLDAVHTAADEQGRRLGLRHGDVRPGALMISRHGDLRVLDFGAPGPRSGSVAGIVDAVPDGRSDLYAVGVVAFEMLTGEPFVMTDGAPPTAESLGALLGTRLVDRLPALRGQLALTHGLSPGQAEHVTDLLVRLLQTDRERRFPHARALVAALESVAEEARIRRGRRWLAAVAGGRPVTDRSGLEAKPLPPSVPEPAPAPEARPAPSWLLPTALVVTLLVALGAAALWADDGGPDPLAITQAPTAAQLNAAVAQLPPLRIAHTPPLRGPHGGDRVFRATVSGGTVDCVPRLHMRAVAGGRWTSRPMRGTGAQWELPMTAGELDAFAGAVEYWIRCGRSGLAPRAAWRSADAPVRLDL